MTGWVIITTRTFTDMDGLGTDYAEGDSLTINSGGIVPDDLSIGGAGSLAITVNAGGSFIQSAGISLLFANGYGFSVAEGGIARCVGTSGSHCTVIGGGTVNTANYFGAGTGGKMYLDYTDVSNFYGFGATTSISASYEIHNSTITGMGYHTINISRGSLLITNSTVDAAATRYCILSTSDLVLMAINSAFTSITDNKLFAGAFSSRLSFAGCTYQGIAIVANDIDDTTSDIGIAIYEKSVATCSGNLAGCAVAAVHPSQDIDGLLYDSTNYLKMPSALDTGLSNASGVSNLYLLQKSAYWPSGLAVGSRTWKYWSDSSQAETGDNQKFTIGAYKSGYLCAGTTAWSGAAAAITMTVASTGKKRLDSEL